MSVGVSKQASMSQTQLILPLRLRQSSDRMNYRTLRFTDEDVRRMLVVAWSDCRRRRKTVTNYNLWLLCSIMQSSGIFWRGSRGVSDVDDRHFLPDVSSKCQTLNLAAPYLIFCVASEMH